MNYKIKDEITCPNCGKSKTFYDEDCLNNYYICPNCDNEIENSKQRSNTKTFAENVGVLRGTNYIIDDGKIWIDSNQLESKINYSPIQLEFLIKSDVIAFKHIKYSIDWLEFNKYRQISVKKMSSIIHKSEDTIRKYIRDGRIKAEKVKGKWIINP